MVVIHFLDQSGNSFCPKQDDISIQEVLSLNPCQDTGNPDSGFLWYFSVSWGRGESSAYLTMRHNCFLSQRSAYLTMGHNCFLSHPLQFIVLLITQPIFYYFPVALWSNSKSWPPLLGLHSHTHWTHHTRYDCSGWVISPMQRPLPDNTQCSQETNICAPKLDWSVCTCLTQLYVGREMYRIYYIKNNYMFRHFTLAIFRLRNEKT